MKWGVRRYQNKDGSYTAEGRRRYSKGNGRHGLSDEILVKDPFDGKPKLISSPTTQNGTEIRLIRKNSEPPQMVSNIYKLFDKKPETIEKQIMKAANKVYKKEKINKKYRSNNIDVMFDGYELDPRHAPEIAQVHIYLKDEQNKYVGEIQLIYDFAYRRADYYRYL